MSFDDEHIILTGATFGGGSHAGDGPPGVLAGGTVTESEVLDHWDV